MCAHRQWQANGLYVISHIILGIGQRPGETAYQRAEAQYVNGSEY